MLPLLISALISFPDPNCTNVYRCPDATEQVLVSQSTLPKIFSNRRITAVHPDLVQLSTVHNPIKKAYPAAVGNNDDADYGIEYVVNFQPGLITYLADDKVGYRLNFWFQSGLDTEVKQLPNGKWRIIVLVGRTRANIAKLGDKELSRLQISVLPR